jgi:hypothetical protein
MGLRSASILSVRKRPTTVPFLFKGGGRHTPLLACHRANQMQQSVQRESKLGSVNGYNLATSCSASADAALTQRDLS